MPTPQRAKKMLDIWQSSPELYRRYIQLIDTDQWLIDVYDPSIDSLLSCDDACVKQTVDNTGAAKSTITSSTSRSHTDGHVTYLEFLDWYATLYRSH